MLYVFAIHQNFLGLHFTIENTCSVFQHSTPVVTLIFFLTEKKRSNKDFTSRKFIKLTVKKFLECNSIINFVIYFQYLFLPGISFFFLSWNVIYLFFPKSSILVKKYFKLFYDNRVKPPSKVHL